MSDWQAIQLPDGFDWRYWVERWDGMQARYLVRRQERFAVLARVICDTQPAAPRILDLGCGPGSLMEALLEALPQAEVVGVDFDPGVLLLARERLGGYGARAQVLLADLRADGWNGALSGAVDAVVSATALHWLTADELQAVYRQVAQLLCPGGVFLNADHVGSDDERIQVGRSRHRQVMRDGEGTGDADDWDGFWEAYNQALGPEVAALSQSSTDDWEGGVEDGLPLAWQLDTLRACGFRSVDCFWRCDNDAIYGGIRGRP
jgi:SAM-dependent methyltransferase